MSFLVAPILWTAATGAAVSLVCLTVGLFVLLRDYRRTPRA